ncbi:hypothetical protein [Bradyrhizobium sp.]|jgi:hypothetical protein|uniref:hypothetical protein n=1 Tax=Bradyrhizobium sp. TaxID=376 RepID=UPI003C77EC8E
MGSLKQYQLEPDHGLPLVQLKERRRELVIALRHREGPPTTDELMEIAAVQQAISAFADVVADLDAGSETDMASAKILSMTRRSA